MIRIQAPHWVVESSDDDHWYLVSLDRVACVSLYPEENPDTSKLGTLTDKPNPNQVFLVDCRFGHAMMKKDGPRYRILQEGLPTLEGWLYFIPALHPKRPTGNERLAEQAVILDLATAEIVAAYQQFIALRNDETVWYRMCIELYTNRGQLRKIEYHHNIQSTEQADTILLGLINQMLIYG